MKKKYRIQILLLTLFFLLFSCENKELTSTLKKTDLFSIKYGTFENELNLFSLIGVGDISTRVTMKNGSFYVANSEAKKILELNSYGDLLSLYYNADYNPSPSFSNNSSSLATRKAIAYPFNEIESIAVDERKYLYVVDTLPLDRQEQNSEDKQVLSQIILRFDGDGNFIDYLGQQGPGGTPFPFVKSIYVTNDNELVVVTLKNDGYVVYWFSDLGYLNYTIFIENTNVPDPYKNDDYEHFLNINNIIPSFKDRKLYLSVDYYSGYVDPSSRMQSGLDYKQTLLYELDVDSGLYEEPIQVPAFSEYVTHTFTNENHEIPFDFVGLTKDGWFFFMISTEGGYDIQMLGENGQVVLNRHLEVDKKETLYSTFSLSESGIVSVLSVCSDKAVVSWWRADSLIQAVIKK